MSRRSRYRASEICRLPRTTSRASSALQRAKNRDPTVKLIPGVNHLFQHCTTGAPTEYATIAETFAPEALQLVTDWIVARTAALRK